LDEDGSDKENSSGKMSRSLLAPGSEDRRLELGLEKIKQLDRLLERLDATYRSSAAPQASAAPSMTFRSGSSTSRKSYASSLKSPKSTMSTATVKSLKPVDNENFYFVYGKLSEDDERRIEKIMAEDDNEDNESCDADSSYTSATSSVYLDDSVQAKLSEIDERLSRYVGLASGDVSERSASVLSEASTIRPGLPQILSSRVPLSSLKTTRDIDEALSALYEDLHALHVSSTNGGESRDSTKIDGSVVKDLVERAKLELGQDAPRLVESTLEDRRIVRTREELEAELGFGGGDDNNQYPEPTDSGRDGSSRFHSESSQPVDQDAHGSAQGEPA
jgi:hypothetical protein